MYDLPTFVNKQGNLNFLSWKRSSNQKGPVHLNIIIDFKLMCNFSVKELFYLPRQLSIILLINYQDCFDLKDVNKRYLPSSVF